MVEKEIYIEEPELEQDEKEVQASNRVELIRQIKRGEVILSYSSFNKFCESPKHFIDYKLRVFEATPSMKFGSMVHCAVLEPEKFNGQYYVLPDTGLRPEKDKNMNSKVNQAWKAAMIANANGREVVSAEDYAAAQRIGESIRRNDIASEILSKCHDFEVSIEWEYKGFKWQGKMDGDGRRNGVILDLKVLSDVSPRKVANYVKYEGAGRQAVHYLRGANAEHCDYYILAADKFGNSSVSLLGKGLLNQLSREIDWYIGQFKKCVFLNEWNASYDFYAQNGIHEINAL